MEKIKPPSVAGKFYTADKDALISQLTSFKNNLKKDYSFSTRAAIVPHAGYVYSGQLAFEGLNYLDENIKNVFIFAPSHYTVLNELAICDWEKWLTPLGEISVNTEINKELAEKFGCEYKNEAYRNEHSAEIQVPILQYLFSDLNIIPVLVGTSKCEKISQIIDYYWDNPENGFLISSDLSHFYKNEDARKLDSLTAEMIEFKDVEGFNPHQACGSIGICGITKFAIERKFSMIRVGLQNSGEITGENSNVVGYGSWILFEGEKNSFIKEYFSNLTLDICRKSIESVFENSEFDKNDYKIPAVFYQAGASFVTLEKQGSLRGCIGSILAHQPLIDDLIKNSKNSAFSDPRFLPLKEEEFPELSISISLLSEPVRMEFKDEAELLEKIKPFEDGIIIKDGGYQAVYLPSVWEQLPDKVDFLTSLKEKAGLSPEHFSKTFMAYKFNTVYIED